MMVLAGVGRLRQEDYLSPEQCTKTPYHKSNNNWNNNNESEECFIPFSS